MQTYRRTWLFVFGLLAGCVGLDTADDTEDPQAQADQALAGCSARITNGGHNAVGSCPGVISTGTFQVEATCCLTHCTGPLRGPLVSQQGHTSTVFCGSAFASNARIIPGPASGLVPDTEAR